MALQMSALPRVDCRAWTAYSGSGRWVCFTGQSCTVQEYIGHGSKVPLCLGFRPADGLSVELEGWTSAYRIASVGHSLTRCTPPWRSGLLPRRGVEEVISEAFLIITTYYYTML